MGRGLGRYDALALTAGLWFLAKFLRYAFPPLFPTFAADLGATNTVLGAAFTAMMLVYAAMQFPSGVLGDRLGPVRVIAAGGLVAAAAAALLTATTGFWPLVAGMVLVGLGTGTHKTVAVGLLGAVYRRRPGRALGVLDTLGAFGGVAAPAVVVAVVDGPGWRTLFAASALAGAVLVGLFVRRVPRHLDDGAAAAADAAERGDGTEGSDPTAPADSTTSADPTGPTAGGSGYLAAVRDRRLVAFVAVTVLFSFGYNGVVAFLPLYLSSTGLSTAAAGLLYSLLFLLSVVQAATGELSDRIGRLPVVAALLTLSTASLAAMVALGNAGLLVLGALVVGFGAGAHGYRPVRAAHFVSVLPADSTGGVLGGVRTLLMGAGALAPVVVGGVADAASFSVAFWLLVAAMAASAALAGVLALSGDE